MIAIDRHVGLSLSYCRLTIKPSKKSQREFRERNERREFSRKFARFALFALKKAQIGNARLFWKSVKGDGMVLSPFLCDGDVEFSEQPLCHLDISPKCDKSNLGCGVSS